MGGHPERDGAKTGRDERRDSRPFPYRQDQREGTGPEGGGEPIRFGREPRDPARGLDVGRMGDQGVEPGPALGLEDPRDGAVVARRGA